MSNDFEEELMQSIYGESEKYPKVKSPNEIDKEYVFRRISNIEKDIKLFSDWYDFSCWMSDNGFDYSETTIKKIQVKAREDCYDFSLGIFTKLIELARLSIDDFEIEKPVFGDLIEYRTYDFLFGEMFLDSSKFQDLMIELSDMCSKVFNSSLHIVIKALDNKGMVSPDEIKRWNKKQADKWGDRVCPHCGENVRFKYEWCYRVETVDKYGNGRASMCVICPKCHKRIVLYGISNV